MTHYTIQSSPLGELLLASNGEALTGLFMTEQAHAPARSEEWRRADGLPVLRAAREQLGAYFDGSLREFALPLCLGGTEFQRSVWAALQGIPYGATCSYGELAGRIGKPQASRAVGLANGRNPIGIIVPCHRVIGANGSLTGYGGGVERKRFLLGHEAGVRGL